MKILSQLKNAYYSAAQFLSQRKDLIRSFQIRVLLSYLPLILIFMLWSRVYMSIDDRRDALTEKIQKFENLENRFLENNTHLQEFLLRGYRSPSFYKDGAEPSIDKFLSNQIQLQNSIRKLKYEFAEEGIDINTQIDSIFILNTQFIRSIEYLKQLMYERGYGEFGLEGKMRQYAHGLEDSGRVSRESVLQLRRLEKDFLRRGNAVNTTRFYVLIDQLKKKYRQGSDEYFLLTAYEQSFKKLVELDQKIGINDMSGAYAEVQEEMVHLGNFYEHMVLGIKSRSELLYSNLRGQLWIVSIIMAVVLLVVSFYLSRDLTKDIHKLNKKMFSFIKSEFKTYKYQNFRPRNTEVASLNNSFEELIFQLRITLKRIEEEKQRAEKTAEYKSLFLANMSHEIRTPLNGVIGMLHMLQSTRLTQKQKQYMDVVEYSANHLLDLVNMILDHSKMDAKKMQLEEIEFDLAGDMKKLIKIFEFKAQEKGLNVNLELDGDFGRKVVGDSLRLQQVLINLLNNAIKFTNNGNINLRITELASGRNWQKIKFEVEDTGIGISKSHQRRLFEAFEQLDGSTTRQYGGTGLGLAISNQLVGLMGGQIEVESLEGKGSIFCFELKVNLGKTQSKTSSRKIKKTTSRLTPTQSYQVLLAEDNPVNQKVITLMLEQNGGEVSIASNGLEAVEKFQGGEFDIVLMDLQMPEMDGLEAAKIIKSSDKYTNTPVPIIAVTANAFSEDRKRAFEAGMDDFLTKPIRPEEFNGILAKYAPRLLAS